MRFARLSKISQDYPSALKAHLGTDAPESITALGNLDLLRYKTLAFFCSIKCPGDLILKTYDLAQSFRERGTTVIGGFHSPMERECLTVLLRGSQPVILCPARNIGARVRPEHKEPLEQERLLILSPFDEKQRRATQETSVVRNRFVAALADTVIVAYAEPNGKMEQLCREVLAWGKPLYTLADDANGHLIALGAKPVPPDNPAGWF
jgi:predicted Rossmann fold nucleotide-binding protein DprA/Smf involved in DNA uptake